MALGLAVWANLRTQATQSVLRGVLKSPTEGKNEQPHIGTVVFQRQEVTVAQQTRDDDGQAGCVFTLMSHDVGFSVGEAAVRPSEVIGEFIQFFVFECHRAIAVRANWSKLPNAAQSCPLRQSRKRCDDHSRGGALARLCLPGFPLDCTVCRYLKTNLNRTKNAGGGFCYHVKRNICSAGILTDVRDAMARKVPRR